MIIISLIKIPKWERAKRLLKNSETCQFPPLSRTFSFALMGATGLPIAPYLLDMAGLAEKVENVRSSALRASAST